MKDGRYGSASAVMPRFRLCKDCGSVVWSIDAHDEFHAGIDTMGKVVGQIQGDGTGRLTVTNYDDNACNHCPHAQIEHSPALRTCRIAGCQCPRFEKRVINPFTVPSPVPSPPPEGIAGYAILAPYPHEGNTAMPGMFFETYEAAVKWRQMSPLHGFNIVALRKVPE